MKFQNQVRLKIGGNEESQKFINIFLFSNK